MSLELTSVAIDWEWLLDLRDFTLVCASPFGDLFLRDATGALGLLDINLGVFEFAGSPGDDPIVLFPISFDDRLAKGYREAGLILGASQCYGLKRQGVAGGSFEPENIYVATMEEYIRFMGDFHRQIQEVPDGGTITIKAINQKVVQ
jgi:hypothetical protein